MKNRKDFLRYFTAGLVLLLTVPAASLTFAADKAAVKDVTQEVSLADLVKDRSPWLHPAANSEQRQPVYLGATPREMAIGIEPADGNKAVMYEALRELGNIQAKIIKNALTEQGNLLPGKSLELEAWPVVDELGQLTWAFARWREDNGAWRWLDSGIMRDLPAVNPAPILPITMDVRNKDSFFDVFGNVLEMKSLYDKPRFGECVWGDFEAWLPVEEMSGYGAVTAEKIASSSDVLECRVLYQPARLSGKPVTFIITVKAGEVIWPAEISWKRDFAPRPGPQYMGPRVKKWPDNFIEAYKNDVLVLAGEKEAVFPISKRQVTFKKKNSIDKDNQLNDLVGYLEERYKVLGIKTVRQDFTWKGIPQTNLIAVIPGSDPDGRPVLMADHIDTAFCEDIYDATGERVSAPGADDNVSATAVLLRAAEILRGMGPEHEIWLVHLTGEEFPADDLGARYMAGKLLKDKKDIEGLVLMDMIGYRESGDDIFQVNPGDSEASLRLAKIAIDASKSITAFKPVLRTRYDEKSYLYNTDGLIFSESGYPVVYLNEHMNKLENFYRKGYHHSTDTSKKIDWAYATDIGKVAIETAAELAEARAR